MLKHNGHAVLIDMGLARNLQRPRYRYKARSDLPAIPAILDKMVVSCHVVLSHRIWSTAS